MRIFYALVRQGKVLRLYPVAFPLFRRNKSMKNMRGFSLRVEGDDEAILAIKKKNDYQQLADQKIWLNP